MRATLLLLCLVPACLPTEPKVVSCTSDTECTAIAAGLRCDQLQHVCTCEGTSFPGCEKPGDGGLLADGPSDAPVPPADVGEPPDGPAEVQIPDAPEDSAVPDTAVDTRVPDAAGTCGVDSDCPSPARSFCVAGVCTGCTASLCASRIDGGTSVCATSGTLAGQCVDCVADGQCTSSPGKPFCVNNTCTGCSAVLCAGKVDGGASSVCATTGAAAGQCVECVADAQCMTNPARAFCVSNACTACTATLCAARTNGKTVCAATGSVAGQCVECVDNTGCTANPAKGFCVANACTACTSTLCAGRTDGKTTCASSGSFTGQCVACTSNAQCTGTTPICASATDVCRACGSDTECTGIGPGVCMTDGHCAADLETVYVGTSGNTTCSDTTGTGGVSAPVCSAQNGVTIAKTGSKSVVLVRGALTPPPAGFTTTIAISAPLTIVGRAGAVLTAAAGADAITITSGDITLRNLTIQGNATPATGIGITAQPTPGSTVTLHMDTCAVTNNPGGGILLNGAAFDIQNTTVTDNGPGTSGVGASYGGIRIESLPATGPTNLSLVTIQNNKQVGLSCSALIAGAGVLASGNVGGIDINTTCNVTACTPASTTCGAQSTPQ